MIAGALIGVAFSPVVRNYFDPWFVVQPRIAALLGALAGVIAELCLQRRIAVELVVAVVIIGSVLALTWAMAH